MPWGYLCDFQVHLDREKALADAQFYTAKKEAEANALLFTQEYLEEQAIRSLRKSKYVVGSKIPSTLVMGDSGAPIRGRKA
jgi:hypothetical protein